MRILKLWDFISDLGYSEDLAYEETRRIKLLCRVNFIVLVVLILYVGINIRVGQYLFATLIGLTICLLLLCMVLLSRNIYPPAKHLSIFSVAFCVSFFVLVSGNTFSEVFFIPLAAVPLIIFKNKKVAIYYIIGFIILIFLLKLSQPFFSHISPFGKKHLLFFNTLNVIFATILTYVLTFYFKNANEEYESILITMGDQIAKKNKEIVDSIEYAKHIQNGILPSVAIINDCLPQSFIYYKPKDIVAGDFYWLERKNEYVIFAACDCTGHGVPGAMISVVCSNALNRAVKEFGLIDPGDILNKVRELVVETFAKSEDEIKDGMDVSLCCWNKTTNELLWAGANNPLWHIQNKELRIVAPNKQSIGKAEVYQPFKTHRINLKTGDCFYVFTDGYADQFGGEKGKKFKSKQLQGLLISISDKTAEEQKELLSSQLDAWKGKLEQIDDILVLGVRV